jgi:large subunit ribosomal protein L16
MLQPKNTLHKKVQKGRIKGIATRGSAMNFGDFGLKVLEPGRITAKQIETIRIILSKLVKKTGKMWIRIFPDKPITKKPAEVRMGKGKGAVEYWVSVVRPGKILFEIIGVSKDEAIKVFDLVSSKLHLRTRVVFSKFV